MTDDAIVAVFVAIFGGVIVVALLFASPDGCADDCTRNGGVWVRGAVWGPVCVAGVAR